MGKIFIAFTGKKLGEKEEIRHRVSHSIECWNLQKMDFDTFVNLVKNEIHPINTNIANDRYAQDIWKCDVKQLYQEKASFGLLLPTPETNRNFGYDREIIHAINLFSPAFLYPIFHVDDLGCSAALHLYEAKEYDQNDQLVLLGQKDQSQYFRTENFVSYYQKMFGALGYYAHDRNREDEWCPNDWQLCWVHSLFADLRRYQNTGKRQGFFLRECVDLCVILESLNNKKEDGIKYKLKKRLSALLPDIEKTIEQLYDLRSDYVHGNIFRKMKGFEDGSPTSEDFDFLEKCTACVRRILIAYTYLYLHKASFAFPKKDVMSWLESAILDCNMRMEIQRKADEILCLLPPISSLAS